MGEIPQKDPYFATTHWSVILAADGSDTVAAHRALEALCRSYWYPIYAFVRRRGSSSHDAEDLTQSFFHHILTRGALGRVDPRKGRFRSFLLAALDYFLANEWRAAHRLKRGGGIQIESLDVREAEDRYSREPSRDLTPEQLYAERWARTLLGEVLRRLEREYQQAGKRDLFAVIQIFLNGDRNQTPYAELAVQLATTEGALKMAVARLRKRYGELLRLEIERTVSEPGEVEDELRALYLALGGG